MSFTGNEDHSISLSDAAAMTKSYRNSAGSGAIIGAYYGKAAINTILAQTGCVGIRIYYAIDSSGTKQMVIVGVDSSENDLCNGSLADRGLTCPSRCSSSNPLNTNTTGS